MKMSKRAKPSLWIYSMGLLASLLAACTGASAQWSKQSPKQIDLDGVARASLPKDFLFDRGDTTPDFTRQWYHKVYKTHINGTTSYSEDLGIVVYASDYPRERFDDDLASGRAEILGKPPGLGENGEGGLRWKVTETVYERHPVTEPSWNIRVDDRARGVIVTWRGFKKQYTLEQAKKNLSEFIGNVAINSNALAVFQSRRSWADGGWEAAYTSNLRVAKSVLAEKQLTLGATESMSRKGLWRLYVDNERPQTLHVIHELSSIKRPEGPIGLLAPVTVYIWYGSYWYQTNQGAGGGILPDNAQKALETDFTDQGKMYFYQITGVDMWKAYGSEKEFGDMLRALLSRMESEHTRLLRDGFFKDATPP